MLDLTFELISIASSNSLVVFSSYNLIIAAVLVGSSKPCSKLNEEKPDDSSTVIHDQNLQKSSVILSSKVNDFTMVEEDNASSSFVNMTMNCNEEEEEGSPDEEDDDALRQRVEDFIEKIKRGWRAEILKTLVSGQ